MKNFDFGGNGQPLHFLHANGFPPDCYKPLFEILQTEYHVFGMLLRPLWGDAKMESITNWVPFSDDLRAFLASSAPHNERATPLSANPKPDPVIGVGHSVGAIATLRAAMRDPGLFHALILLDPVLFVPKRLVEWKIQRAKNPTAHPLIQGAMRRRRTFAELESVFSGYRDRDLFRYMSDAHLRIYIDGITQPSSNGGFELVFSPEWEARIYSTGLQDFDIWNNLENLRVPTLFIRGAETDTFLEDAANLVKQKQPKAKVETLEQSTHLLPLERPQEVFDIIHSFVKSLESDSQESYSNDRPDFSNLIV